MLPRTEIKILHKSYSNFNTKENGRFWRELGETLLHCSNQGYNFRVYFLWNIMVMLLVCKTVCSHFNISWVNEPHYCFLPNAYADNIHAAIYWWLSCIQHLYIEIPWLYYGLFYFNYLTIILLEMRVMNHCHQYRSRPGCTLCSMTRLFTVSSPTVVNSHLDIPTMTMEDGLFHLRNLAGEGLIARQVYRIMVQISLFDWWNCTKNMKWLYKF